LLDAGRFPQIYLPLIGVGIAALWPLTAYALSPLLLPAICVLVATVVVIIGRPEYGLASAAALTPFVGLQIQQPALDDVTLPTAPVRVLLPVIVIGVVLYGTLVRGQDRRQLSGMFLGIALLLGAAALSAFQALDPAKSIPDIFLLLTGAAMFVGILNICQTREQLLVVVAGVLVGLLLASIQGVVQQLTGVYSTLGFVVGGEIFNRVQGSFGHPNEYAGYLALLLPFAIAVLFTSQLPVRLRALAGVAAGVAVPALVFSYSRGALATLVVGSLFWLLVMRPKAAVAVAIVVGAAALLLAPGTLRERFSESGKGDIALRTDVADSALEIYADHPLAGVGIGNFQLAYQDLSFADEVGQRRLLHTQQVLVPTAAPSQYVNSLAEQGLLGVAALGVFTLTVLATVHRVGRARDPATRGLGLGIGMSAASLFLYSLLEVSLQEDQILPLFVLLGIAAVAESAFGQAVAPANRLERGATPAGLSHAGVGARPT
jgi:O-antigen ligase